MIATLRHRVRGLVAIPVLFSDGPLPCSCCVPLLRQALPAPAPLEQVGSSFSIFEELHMPFADWVIGQDSLAQVPVPCLRAQGHLV